MSSVSSVRREIWGLQPSDPIVTEEWAGHDLLVSFRPLALAHPEVPDESDLVQPPAHEDRPVGVGRVSVFYDA